MKTEKFAAPSYQQLRPFRSRPTEGGKFPVYDDLAGMLASAHVPGVPAGADPAVAHVLGTGAGYAYADGATVAMMMARLGLEANCCVTVSELVDAMFICSTAHLVQSRCGRVVVVCFRGTEPMNLINWLTGADVHPEKISLVEGAAPVTVHAGFYRNVRATRFELANQLQLALRGKSLLDGTDREHGLEALYVAGHSLGGAMAAMFGLMMVTNPVYRPIAEKLRAVYTYGQPMIGAPPLPPECGPGGALGRKTYRYVYAQDVVPALPPTASGPFQHFGREYRFQDGSWREAALPMEQVGNLLQIPLAVSAFFADQLSWFKRFPFHYSLADHGPQHYVASLKPADKTSEFGD